MLVGFWVGVAGKFWIPALLDLRGGGLGVTVALWFDYVGVFVGCGGLDVCGGLRWVVVALVCCRS